MASKIGSLVFALCVLAGLLVAGPAAQAAPAVPPSEWPIGPNKKVVFLTFDGQGKAKFLSEVLDALESKGARATFFISGRWMRYHRAKVRAVRDAGHLVGNRGYGTKAFTEMSDEGIRDSILAAEREAARIGAAPAPFLRPPNGRRDLRVLKVAGSLGYRSVRWTYGAGGGLASKVAKKVLNHLQWGSIIDLDTWRKSHRKALPQIIEGIRAQGFKLRTIEPLTRTHAVRWDVTLRSGSSGPEVSYLQKILKRKTFPSGREDGRFGYATLQATYAFEKVNKLPRDGVITTTDMTKLVSSPRPKARKYKGVKDYVDVDISRQVLFEVRDGKTKNTLPMSSGNEEYYTVDGETYKAHTPRGSFRVERKILGKRESRLGVLYDPVYFIGGFALHGSPSVPTHPASHGCIRLPMYLSRAFYNRNPVGMPVYVHN